MTTPSAVKSGYESSGRLMRLGSSELHALAEVVMPGDGARNVFISHVHEDDGGLADLKNLLGSKGYAVRDSSINSSNPNNANSPDYIKSGILAPRIQWAGVLIVYVSPMTRNSEWVNWEIEYAHREGKRIVGVWARGDAECDVPDALEEYADAVVGWNAERVIDAIEGRVNDWQGPAGVPRPSRPISRHSC